MPRLTRRVFTDLAIWMSGFGLLIGVVFPPFCLILGLPAPQVLAPAFLVATVSAGLVVGAVNWALARLVVGSRLRLLAERMGSVEAQLAAAVFSQDWADCDPEQCALPVDSDDEIGQSAAAFDRLIATLARSHAVETAMREFGTILSSAFELEGLADRALEGLLRHTGAGAGAFLVVREDQLEPMASHASVTSARSRRATTSGGPCGPTRSCASRSAGPRASSSTRSWSASWRPRSWSCR